MKADPGPSGGSVSSARGRTPVPVAPEQPPRSLEVGEEAAAGCAEFERVLGHIAGSLSNVTDGEFDAAIVRCLRRLAEFLGFDRGTLTTFSEHGSRFQATHSWAVDGAPVVPGDVLLNTQIPWFTHQIRSGHIVNVCNTIDLPAAAVKERVYLLHNGIASILAIPMLTEGTILGALSFVSFRHPKRWSPDLVSRLRLAGEILALGIRQHQYARGLRAIAETMDQVSLDHAAPGHETARYSRDRALRLMQAEHLERRRMGQVLHEDVMQVLSAVSMFVQSGKDGMPQAAVSDKALALLKDAVKKLRQLTLELRPEAVFDMTLADGIRWLAGQMRDRYDLEVDVRVTGDVDPVGGDIRSFLYDATRKLLENVAVHSSLNRATLELRRSAPGSIQLTVTDEGVGFNPASLQDLPSAAFGLFSIRERLELFGGTLEMSSSPGRGTRAVVTVPSGD